jgi:DNA-binding MarR family transcriptional regulator
VASRDQISTVDALAQTTFLIQRLLERRAGEHDISLIQMRLLGVLRDRMPTINELGQLLGLDKSSVSGLVDRAQRRGLVARVPSAVDRRSVLVTLTDAGRVLVDDVAAMIEGDITALLEPLPEQDRRSLTEVLGRVLIAHAAERGVDLFSGTAP